MHISKLEYAIDFKCHHGHTLCVKVKK